MQCPRRHQQRGGFANYVDVLFVSYEPDDHAQVDDGCVLPVADAHGLPGGDDYGLVQGHDHSDRQGQVFMVAEDAEDMETISAWTVQPNEEQFFGVIDCGATETVASLHALNAIMQRRFEKYGFEEIRVNPDIQKTFRFGNGRTLKASSYVEIPQTIAGVHTWLGVHSLDTDDRYVPLLLGMRTLQRLSAVIDFGTKTACFPSVSDRFVPLPQCDRTGHLLVDLSSDWIDHRFEESYKVSLAAPLTSCSMPDPSEHDLVYPNSESHQEQLLIDDSDMYDGSEVKGSEVRGESTCLCDEDMEPHAECHLPEPGLKDSQTLSTNLSTAEHGGSEFGKAMPEGPVWAKGQGQGEGPEDETPGRGSVRFLPDRTGQSSRSPTSRRSLRWSAHSSALRTWLGVGQEWMGHVEDMSTLPSTIGVRSSLRSPWKISKCGTNCSGHQGAVAGEGQRDSGSPRGAFNPPSEFGCCREEPRSPPGSCQEAEAGLCLSAEGNSASFPNREDASGFYEEDDGRDQEGHQEGQREGSRGGGGGSCQSRQLMGRCGEAGMMRTPESVRSLI